MKPKIYLLFFVFFIQTIGLAQVLDQFNPPNFAPTGYGYNSVNSVNSVAQSFKPGMTSRLSQISVKMGGGSSGDFNLRILEGEGTGGTVLNTTSFNVSIIGTTEVTIPLSSNPLVISGNAYTFEISTTSASGSVEVHSNPLGGFNGHYLNGNYYFNNAMDNSYDLWFRTYLLPPATHLHFDGTNDNVVIPDSSSLDFTTAYTVEAMVKLDRTVGYHQTVVSKFEDDSNNRSWMINFGEHGGGALAVVMTSVGTWTNPLSWNTTFVPTIGTWYHIAVVFDSSLPSNQVKLYVNGALYAQTNWNYTLTPTNANVYIGGYDGFTNGFNAGANSRFLKGNIDEVRMWNVARTATQIAGSKNCELQGTETGLVAYYKFNHGFDASTNTGVTTLTDATANSNNGTLTNLALTGTTSNWLAGSPVTTGSVIPSAPTVTTPVTYNQGDTAIQLTTTSGTGLLWYTTATGGTGSTTAPSPDTTTGGSTSYWVSSANSNGCESARSQIDVVVIEPATHLNFDGVNDYVVTNNSNLPLGTSSRTVEFWVKTAQTFGSHTLFSYGNALSINNRIAIINASGKFYFSANGNDYNTNITIADNIWHHIAFTFDVTSKLYLDGVLVASPTLAPFNTTGTQVILGAGTTSLFEPFNGSIDEVRIWNVARTASQISRSKDCELQGNEAGLVFYYKFNQGNSALNNTSITTLNNAVSGGGDGTLTNLALIGSASNFLAGSPVTTGIKIPSAPTASAQTFCFSNAPTVSDLLPASSSTIKWYNTADGGSELATTTALATGTYYVLEVNANGCESDRTSVAVTVNAQTPTAVATQLYAGTATIANLTATGTALQWYDVVTGGTALASTTNLVNDTTYYVSQTIDGCESMRTPVVAHEISTSSQTFCTTSNPTVADLTSTPSAGATVSWYATATGGTALSNETLLNSGTYYVEETTTSIITLGSGFLFPTDVAIQTDGKIVVADYINSAIKRMNVDGTGIETLGSGFSYPIGIAIQTDGKIVVADNGNNAIKRMNADGTGIETLETGFSFLAGVAIQTDGKIVVVDYGNNAIKRINADGTGMETIGYGFFQPNDVAVQTDGKIVVADSGNNAIKRMNADSTGIETLGSGFIHPTGVAIQTDGKIVVADNGNNAIKRMNADSTGIETLGSDFYMPQSVAIQTNGEIVVADYGNSAIKRISAASTSIRVPVSVIVNTIPAPTASAQTHSYTATVADLVATGDTGATFNWYLSSTGGTALASSTTLTTGTYYVSQTVFGCESTRTAVAVTTKITSSLTSVYCGSTISNLYVTLAATWVSYAQGYRFKVTNTATNAFQIVDRPVNNLALCNVPGVTLNTQYKIEVAVKRNGVWDNFYGAPCYVSTPNPQPTIGSQCGTTLTTMNDWILTTAVANVSVYRFRITNTTDNSVQIKDNPYNKVSFSQLANKAYATTYTIEVAVKNTNGTFLSYGTPCNVTTPNDPNAVLVTKIEDNIDDKNAIVDFNVVAFPNPFTNDFKINIESTSSMPVEVKVYDMLGKLLEIQTVNSSEISNIEIGSRYASGVYNVIVSQGENNKTLRMVKR